MMRCAEGANPAVGPRRLATAWAVAVFALCAVHLPAEPVSDTATHIATDTAPDAAAHGRVLVLEGDPYLPLAEIIQRDTGFAMVHSLEAALAGDPVFLIWVVSPEVMSDALMVQYGQAVGERPRSIALGFITGPTLESAQALWQRRDAVLARHLFAAQGKHPTDGSPEARVLDFTHDPPAEQPLTVNTLREALRAADYLTFAGHGTPRGFRLDDAVTLKAGDVPSLGPLVVTTSSCNTFRFWETDSLLNAFIEQGVAGYAGHAYSPNGGYQMGSRDGLVMRYTWSEFPVGVAIQVLNHGARQGYAAFPYLHFAGDPRLCLRTDPPCRNLSIDRSHNTRDIRIRGDAPRGVLPLRIPGAAGAAFVRVRGVTAAAFDDGFYNARLQMADIGDDRFLLFLHPGGPFEVTVTGKPFAWAIRHGVFSALDQTLIVDTVFGRSALAVAVGALGLAALLPRRRCRRHWKAAALTALLAAALHALWAFGRLEAVTVTSKPVLLSALAIPGTALTVFAGVLLFLSARGIRGRTSGLILADSVYLISPAVLGIGIALANRAVASRLHAPLWNHSLTWLSLIAALIITALTLLAFPLAQYVERACGLAGATTRPPDHRPGSAGSPRTAPPPPGRRRPYRGPDARPASPR